jgi:competence protein ComEA
VLLIVCCLTIGSLAAAPAATAKKMQTAGDAKPATIDLNKANSEQLQTIRGIGPSLARRIIQFRKENGSFKRVEDLLKVRGIGEKSLAKISPYLVVKS